jgi:endonuclease/exonuclease/phosphatase family metal-dependent hydrolase
VDISGEDLDDCRGQSHTHGRILSPAAFGGVQEGNHRHVSGYAVLSRWPIELEAQSRLECQDSWPKVLLHVSTAGIDVYCVHLTAALDGAAVREARVLVVEEFIRATAGPASALPPVLAGAFNAGPRASAIAFLRGRVPAARALGLLPGCLGSLRRRPGHYLEPREPAHAACVLLRRTP